MRTSSGIDEHGENPNPYPHENQPYKKRRDGAVGPQSPGTVGPRVVQCLSPMAIHPGNSTPGPFLRPVDAHRRINRYGNEYHREIYGDGTDSYWYNNRDGSYFKKYRDGSTVFYRRGSSREYPAPVSDESVGPKEHSSGAARDVSQRYPVEDRSVPATRREDIQQAEPANSASNRIEDGHKHHHLSQSTTNQSTSPTPPISQRPSANWRSRAEQKSKTNRSTKTRNQESVRVGQQNPTDGRRR